MSSTTTGGIGFIGLGIMGVGMAGRLLSENVAGTSQEKPLVIWNRTTSKCTELKEKFPDKCIVIADSPKAVIESCSVTYTILSTPEVSRAVFEEPNTGVLAGFAASTDTNKSIVDCATLAEEDMKRMNDAIVAKGGRFLEAPVSGSKAPAAKGALIFLCAGSEDLFNEVTSGLDAMGKASHFFGTTVGYGTRAKLVVNSLMGTMMAAFGEGLALSESVGLDPIKMIEVIGQGAAGSPMYNLKGAKMIKKDHTTNFPLKHAHKDMALASNMAAEAGVEFSVINQAEQIFRAAREDANLDLADQDFSAVFEKIHDESKSEFSKKRKNCE